MPWAALWMAYHHEPPLAWSHLNLVVALTRVGPTCSMAARTYMWCCEEHTSQCLREGRQNEAKRHLLMNAFGNNMFGVYIYCRGVHDT